MMWRYAVGVVAGLLLALGGVLLLRPSAVAKHALLGGGGTVAADDAIQSDGALPEPPAADEKTREQKRFSRYDHDKDGKVGRDEYLAARHKAFAKLDKNGDGKLDFDEWAAKAETKFADADKDRTGTLTPEEFATTRVVRKTKPRVNCPPAAAPAAEKKDEEDS